MAVTRGICVEFYTMLTVPEAARRAGRSAETIRRWIWNGRLPARKIGNQHVIETEALDALVGRDESEREVAAAGDIPHEWRDWFARVDDLHERLRDRGVALPSGADMVRESRRGR